MLLHSLFFSFLHVLVTTIINRTSANKNRRCSIRYVCLWIESMTQTNMTTRFSGYMKRKMLRNSFFFVSYVSQQSISSEINENNIEEKKEWEATMKEISKNISTIFFFFWLQSSNEFLSQSIPTKSIIINKY